MTRRPLLAVGLVSTLLGGIVSGCSDAGTKSTSAAANGADSASVQAAANVAKEQQSGANAAASSAAGGDDFASAWGPAVGTNIPLLAANDHSGAAQDLASLSGEKGLLLVFSRSADW